jgi:hypothetical protein
VQSYTIEVLTLDSPIIFPFGSETSIPFSNSFCRMSGILTQFAAATAAKGTYLCREQHYILNMTLSPMQLKNNYKQE